MPPSVHNFKPVLLYFIIFQIDHPSPVNFSRLVLRDFFSTLSASASVDRWIGKLPVEHLGVGVHTPSWLFAPGAVTLFCRERLGLGPQIVPRDQILISRLFGFPLSLVHGTDHSLPHLWPVLDGHAAHYRLGDGDLTPLRQRHAIDRVQRAARRLIRLVRRLANLHQALRRLGPVVNVENLHNCIRRRILPDEVLEAVPLFGDVSPLV